MVLAICQGHVASQEVALTSIKALALLPLLIPIPIHIYQQLPSNIKRACLVHIYPYTHTPLAAKLYIVLRHCLVIQGPSLHT